MFNLGIKIRPIIPTVADEKSWQNPQNPDSERRSFASRKWVTGICFLIFHLLSIVPLFDGSHIFVVISSSLDGRIVQSAAELSLYCLIGAQVLLPHIARPAWLVDADKKSVADKTFREIQGSFIFSNIVVKMVTIPVVAAFGLLHAQSNYFSQELTLQPNAAMLSYFAVQYAVIALCVCLLEEALRVRGLFAHSALALLSASIASSMLFSTTQPGAPLGILYQFLSSFGAAVSPVGARLAVQAVLSILGTCAVGGAAVWSMHVLMRVDMYRSSQRKVEQYVMAPLQHALQVQVLLLLAVALQLPAALQACLPPSSAVRLLLPLTGLWGVASWFAVVARALYVLAVCLVLPRVWAHGFSPSITPQGVVAALQKRNMQVMECRHDPDAMWRVVGSAVSHALLAGPLLLAGTQLLLEASGGFGSAPLLFVLLRFLREQQHIIRAVVQGVDIDGPSAASSRIRHSQSTGPPSGQGSGVHAVRKRRTPVKADQKMHS